MSYFKYIKSPEWKKKRKQVLAVYKNPNCVVCSRKGVHIHHRTYKRLGGERLNDLIPLCPSCHRLFHKYHGYKFFNNQWVLNAVKIYAADGSRDNAIRFCFDDGITKWICMQAGREKSGRKMKLKGKSTRRIVIGKNGYSSIKIAT